MVVETFLCSLSVVKGEHGGKTFFTLTVEKGSIKRESLRSNCLSIFITIKIRSSTTQVLLLKQYYIYYRSDYPSNKLKGSILIIHEAILTNKCQLNI